MKRMTPRVSVLIVNYNAGHHLARCIAALRRQTMAEFEAIVVDNASSDRSLVLARDAAEGDARLVFDEVGANLGFAAGNNRAAARARAKWLATLNPDAFAEPDWLARLLDAVGRHPDADMFGSTQLDDADPAMLDGAGDCYLFCGIPWRGGKGHAASKTPPEGEVFGPCAAAALYRATAFRAAGGFDPAYFCFCEDSDLAFRLRLAGSRCVQVRDAVVHHVGGGSATPYPSFARYHGTRNMIWTFVKNMPPSLLWPLLPAHLAMLAFLCAKAAFRGELAVLGKAFVDAAAGLPRILRARRIGRNSRRANAATIARALCWNPFTYLRRMPHPVATAGGKRAERAGPESY